ncbi:MAG: SDR family NAD(P)-dependent oxidoreductase [Sandaracinaceae bacterium]|nr:SDR family NAD(P)-dependent oxidoreductase [Sandaracinaceae bacterium]
MDLHGRRVIVTGTSEGSLGYETARALATWGAEVVVTRRSGAEAIAQQLASASGGRVEGRDLDLGSTASVRDFVAWYEREHGARLDVLINNAGIHLDLMSDWKEPHLSPDGFELQWRTNYLGPFQLTLGLLPALRATAAEKGDARVVNVASQLHRKATNADLFTPHTPYDSWVAYGASKLAMVHMAFELERRFAGEGLHGYVLHPARCSRTWRTPAWLAMPRSPACAAGSLRWSGSSCSRPAKARPPACTAPRLPGCRVASTSPPVRRVA